VDDERQHKHSPRRERRRFSDDAFARAAAIFRVASDVNRLKLLERLSDREWCVSELASVAGANMSTVSQQLRVLRAEHLVTRRREGSHLYYSLADEHVRMIIRAALEHANEPAITR
jgi:ArsR family transcriptional regulator